MLTGVEKCRRGVRARTMMIVAWSMVAVAISLLGAPAAHATPEYTQPNLATTLTCGSANPWPLGPLPVRVDVYNQIRFPADGLPGPVISLVGYSLTRPQAVEYTVDITVRWRNLRTGRRGAVSVPGRAPSVRWQADLHTGAGLIAFTIRQKIGALAFVPMVNPQYSSCSGRAVA